MEGGGAPRPLGWVAGEAPLLSSPKSCSGVRAQRPPLQCRNRPSTHPSRLSDFRAQISLWPVSRRASHDDPGKNHAAPPILRCVEKATKNTRVRRAAQPQPNQYLNRRPRREWRVPFLRDLRFLLFKSLWKFEPRMDTDGHGLIGADSIRANLCASGVPTGRYEGSPLRIVARGIDFEG